jgi:hypothetical protein
MLTAVTDTSMAAYRNIPTPTLSGQKDAIKAIIATNCRDKSRVFPFVRRFFGHWHDSRQCQCLVQRPRAAAPRKVD